MATTCKKKKSAACGTKSEQYVGLGSTYVKYLSAIVYDVFCGEPMKVTYLNNGWWVTTPGMMLQPLKEYINDMKVGVRFLCVDGGTVGALALAKMLGKALENPESAVDDVLRQRVEHLKRMGVKLDMNEPLLLELDIVSNEGKPARQGKFSAMCRLADDYCEWLFDIDAFQTKQDAEKWVGYYFALLDDLGSDFTII